MVNIPYGSQIEPFYFVEQTPSIWEHFNRLPLLKRAWIVQERILSPRVLHFGQHQLFWECNELTAWEESPLGFSAVARLFPEFANRSRPPVRIIPDDICPNDAGIDMDGFFSIWNEIATAYAGCSLTKESDRVIALSGITSKLRGLVNDTCVTDIWTRSIERQLTWFLWGSPKSPRTKPNVPVAPTWSWLSACDCLL